MHSGVALGCLMCPSHWATESQRVTQRFALPCWRWQRWFLPSGPRDSCQDWHLSHWWEPPESTLSWRHTNVTRQRYISLFINHMTTYWNANGIPMIQKGMYFSGSCGCGLYVNFSSTDTMFVKEIWKEKINQYCYHMFKLFTVCVS